MSFSKLILPILMGITVVLCIALSGCTSPSTTVTNPPSSTSVATTVANVPSSTPAQSPAPSAANVTLGNYQFNPNPVTIAAGGTVTWENDQMETNTITFSGEPENNIRAGGFFTKTFPTPGTYTYHSSINPGTVGQVIVR